MTEQGYQTGNVVIATMLRTLGVGWWKNDDGLEIPCMCQYDLDMLNKLARKELPELEGMDIVEGAIYAHKKGKKGHVKYNFERTELLRTLINAWNKHEKWMSAQAEGNGSSMPTMMDFPDMEPATAARFFCQFSKNRSMVADLWKGATPDVVVFGPSKSGVEQYVDDKTGQLKERYTKTGSLKIMSVRANAATRKALGI
jgi:hypothetical protein